MKLVSLPDVYHCHPARANYFHSSTTELTEHVNDSDPFYMKSVRLAQPAVKGGYDVNQLTLKHIAVHSYNPCSWLTY